MGSAVLAAGPEIAEIRLALPNKHHYLVDLSPFGLENENEVFIAGDRPYGLIEGTVTRDDAPPALNVVRARVVVFVIIIENVAVATVDAADTYHPDGHVVVGDDGRIVAVGAGHAGPLPRVRCAASTAPAAWSPPA